MATFSEVYARTVPFLIIMVRVAVTKATRTDVEVGLWKLDRDWLMIILKEVAQRSHQSLGDLIERCDDPEAFDGGPMFHGTKAFAEFIDHMPPIQIIEFDVEI